MSRSLQRVCTAFSTAYATLLWLGMALLLSNKLTIWSQLGSSERFWTVFASVYASILVLSGILYFTTLRRVAGFTHAALMLGAAGLVGFEIVRGQITRPGNDDAAAGIVAAANLVFVVGGGLAAIFGIGVLYSSLSKPELVNETHDA
jgi:hypothetical protein